MKSSLFTWMINKKAQDITGQVHKFMLHPAFCIYLMICSSRNLLFSISVLSRSTTWPSPPMTNVYSPLDVFYNPLAVWNRVDLALKNAWLVCYLDYLTMDEDWLFYSFQYRVSTNRVVGCLVLIKKHVGWRSLKQPGASLEWRSEYHVGRNASGRTNRVDQLWERSTASALEVRNN
jgi:hypothetical protein